jgi:hypothetical protein
VLAETSPSATPPGRRTRASACRPALESDEPASGSAVIALGRLLPGGEFLFVGENLYRGKVEDAIALAFGKT